MLRAVVVRVGEGGAGGGGGVVDDGLVDFRRIFLVGYHRCNIYWVFGWIEVGLLTEDLIVTEEPIGWWFVGGGTFLLDRSENLVFA